VVLEHGRKIADGEPTDVMADPSVAVASLGVDATTTPTEP
jgi:ABC-type branched-subunit amino acid transport system ATPase component